MSILTKILKKRDWLLEQRYIKRMRNALSRKLKDPSSSKRIYFFCAPTHSNLGDQAQLMCWLRLFAEWYPDYEVVQVPTRYRQFDTLRTIHEKLKDDDLLFIHSGYLFFDPHPELPFILDIIRDFYDKKITILPQTVNIMGEWYQHIVAQIMNTNPNVTLLCRDEVSLKKAEELFPNIHLKLMPDVVTSLIGNKSIFDKYGSDKRSGVLFCLRNDLEKFYSDSDIDTLIARFKHVRTERTDTTIKAPIWEWDNDREQLIGSMLHKFSEFQVIITDRYHGTIFSQIVNVPVVVINSADHKLSSGVKWFPKDKFSQNVYYAHNLDEAYQLANKILERNGKVIMNHSYFKDNYYNTPIHCLG